MSSDSDNHWHATGYRLMIGPLPAGMAMPLPILPFWHPPLFVILSLVWAALIYWLHRKGFGLGGIPVLLRRWLQGRRLTPRRVQR